MSKELCFWILMLLWVVFGVIGYARPDDKRIVAGGNILFFLLFVVVGLALFGAALK